MHETIFRRCIVRCGNTTYVNHGDGRFRDIGNVAGDDLVALVIQMRIPLVRVTVDRGTLPSPQKLLRSNRAFVFNQPKVGFGTNWRTAPIA